MIILLFVLSSLIFTAACDFLLIPPGIPHTLSNAAPDSSYCRFVLWFSQSFFDALCRLDAEGYGYSFRYAEQVGGLHFRPDIINAQEIMGFLMDILEERSDTRPFRLLNLHLMLASFFVSKYHIAHIFKDNMGISIHQYILKKRLHACKNAILSGMTFSKIYTQYGFNDYTVFYRAFKKEFGMSPTAYREQHAITEAIPQNIAQE